MERSGRALSAGREQFWWELIQQAVGRKNSYDLLSSAISIVHRDLKEVFKRNLDVRREKEQPFGSYRRSIRLLFGDWLPHDEVRRTGCLALAAVVKTQNS